MGIYDLKLVSDALAQALPRAITLRCERNGANV
jgi:hypothetical protein